jgi:regulator of ribonuclease activity A
MKEEAIIAFHTADLCDTCGKEFQVLSPEFFNYGGKKKMAGKITTVRLNESNHELKEVLEEGGKGRILVVDVQGAYVAVAGEMIATKAQKKGWEGLVINGYVRDTEQTQKINVGLWALGACPRKCPTSLPGFINHPIEFGGVAFAPDMYLYADADGIIVSEESLVG